MYSDLLVENHEFSYIHLYSLPQERMTPLEFPYAVWFIEEEAIKW